MKPLPVPLAPYTFTDAQLAEGIVAALAATNGRATAHAYTRAEEVSEIAAWAEVELERLGLPKLARKGAAVSAQSGQTLPAKYRNKARTTTVHLTRYASGWRMTDCHPSELWPTRAPFRRLILTAAQDARAVAKLRERYSIAPGPTEAAT